MQSFDNLLAGESLLGQPRDGVGKTSGVGLLEVQVFDPVDLLGDVGQVKVGGEGAHESHRRSEVRVGQCGGEIPSGALITVSPQGSRERSNLLDQLEEAVPFLPGDAMAELAA